MDETGKPPAHSPGSDVHADHCEGDAYIAAVIMWLDAGAICHYAQRHPSHNGRLRRRADATCRYL